MRNAAVQEGANAALALRQRLSLGDDAADLEGIATRRDALVFRHHFGANAPDGMYVYDGEVAMIVVNAAKPPQRQRFTLAHEIGHHELHRVRGPMQLVDVDVNATTDASGAKDPDEVAANAFAAHLLLPRTALEQLLGDKRNSQVTELDLVEIVRRYRVSWSTACWRLYNEEFIRRSRCDTLLAVRRTALLAPHGIDDQHYALDGPAIPPELASKAAQLWARWDITDERLAQILERSVADTMVLMDEWDVERDDRARDAADAGERALEAAGLDLPAIAAMAAELDDEDAS